MEDAAKLLRKGVISFLLFHLCSCTHSTPWNTQCIRTNEADHGSSKLTYKCPDRVRGIDVEFLQTKSSSHLYLIVHSVPIPPLKNNPKEAELTLEIDGAKTLYTVPRHEGGHKLSIPDALKETIITTLQAHHPVTIHLEGYTATLTPEQFSASYDKFQYPFPLSNPFHFLQ